jgi:tetratricopeptide (TPR) repeat protein
LNTFKKYILLLFCFSFTFNGFSQRADPEDAAEHFKFGNYIDALIVYKKLIEKDPKNIDYPYKAGLSVLFTDRDKREAVKFLEIASERKADPDVNFFLAKTYHHNLKLDEALDYFERYKSSGEGTKQAEVDREMEMVRNAQKLIKAPVDITFENAGDEINTEYPDYYPFITPDESFMVFTSRRKSGVREFDGYYPSAIYYSKVDSGQFDKAKKGNSMINSTYDDQAVGLSYNADKLFIYFDDISNVGDIYEADIKDFKFKKKEKMGDAVNSKGFESAATISADGNTLFFASKRDGGLGEKDIYMTKKLPTGDWAEPQNLGENINTPYDEDFPNLFYDGTTLYFSSKGHNSMGGYDYFKSTWNTETNTWSKPENLGYPLNTPDDNVCISFLEDHASAYISAWRPDSKGEKDIYRITFNEIDTRQTVYKSKIMATGSTEPITDAFVSVIDNRTQEEIGTYTPNPKNGSFVMILKPGSYNILIDAPGFAPKNEDVFVIGKSDFVPFTTIEFTVTP